MSFSEQVKARTGEVERIIEKYLPPVSGYQKTVLEAMNYSVNVGGKRIRPMMMQEVNRLMGQESPCLYPFMAAIEMIHTYSLVHDDLPAMDNDEYRRGKKTTHVVYGEAMAILAGDALLNYAYETAVKAFEAAENETQFKQTAKALQVLAMKAGIFGMVGGQTADVEAEDKGIEATEELLMYIHKNKTAALIEAAMMAANIAPGMNRSFTAQKWTNLIPAELWKETVQEAEAMIDKDVQVDIQGYDIDPEVVKAARENAKRAGVDHMIHFQQREVANLRHPKKYGFVITNPPYGERLEEKEDLPKLYEQIGKVFEGLDSWSLYMITSYEDTERYIGRKADKNRKIYNGMIKTYFYQFMGPKPPKREHEQNT